MAVAAAAARAPRTPCNTRLSRPCVHRWDRSAAACMKLPLLGRASKCIASRGPCLVRPRRRSWRYVYSACKTYIVYSHVTYMNCSTVPIGAAPGAIALAGVLKFAIRSDRLFHKGQLLWASRLTLAVGRSFVLDDTFEAARTATQSTPFRTFLPNALPPFAVFFLVEVFGASLLIYGAFITALLWPLPLTLPPACRRRRGHRWRRRRPR